MGSMTSFRRTAEPPKDVGANLLGAHPSMCRADLDRVPEGIGLGSGPNIRLDGLGTNTLGGRQPMVAVGQ